MLRRLGIRGKVLAALSVPVLVLFVLAGFVSLDSVRQAQTARTMSSLLAAVQESREVVLALQAERRTALQYVAGDDAAQPELESSRGVTTDSLKSLRRAVDRIDWATLDPSVSDAVDTMYRDLATLDDVRSRTDSRAVGFRPVATDYTRAIDAVVVLPRGMADGLDDRRLAAIISAHAEVTALAEDYREEQALGAQVLAGVREPEEILHLSTLFPLTNLQLTSAMDAVDNLALADEVVVPRLGASFRNSQSYDSFRTLVATGLSQNLDFIEAADWVQRSGEEIDALDNVQSELRSAARERANEVAGASLRTAGLTIAIALAAVILSVVVAFTIARQIVNPLRRLTEAADVVREELPRLVDQVAIPGHGPDLKLTTIPVTSRDEIGQLASAFNDVNATTIQVAQEQAALRGSIAEMFVNVARRDQVLLNRQLSFIDALERSEEDPKTLADLFRLDHLATRMRRNAESLLVLAGIDTGRRLRDAIPTSDVIRTASSEIEHYERIQLDLPVDPMMLGHTALPAAHLLAELLENATVFSDPGTPVHVSTGIDDDDVLITVLDQGLGMTPEEMADANTKIAATSAGDVLGSQRLGLFVVGRIAARLGARVELARGPGDQGTLVTVRMPRVLFIDAASIPSTPPTERPARIETFVLPEEAAEAVHEHAFAPVPDHVSDVAPGSLGSEQNPAEPVDLGALTDGTTPLGLPRRRSVSADRTAPAPSTYDREAEDAAAAPSIPLAPQADALAGAAGFGDDEVWTPPSVEVSTPLVARRPVAEPLQDDAIVPVVESGAPLPTREPSGAPLPTREPSGTALPSREPTAPLPTREPSGTALPTRQPSALIPPVPQAPPAASTPAAPEGRAAMFSGFRSRRAELAAAAVRVESGDEHDGSGSGAPVDAGDGAERLAAAAAFFGRTPATDDIPRGDSPQAPEPEHEAEPVFVVPSLVDDDEDFGDPVFAPGAPAAVVADPEQDLTWHAPATDDTATDDTAADEPTWQAPAPVQPPAQPPVARQPEPRYGAPPREEDDQLPYFGRHAYVPEDLGARQWPPTEERVGLEDEQPTSSPAASAPSHEVPWPPAPEAPEAETQQDAAPAWAPPTEPAWEPSAAWPPPVTPAEGSQPEQPAPAAGGAPSWGAVTPEPEPEPEPAPVEAAPPVASPAAVEQPAQAAPPAPKRRRRWFGRKRQDAAPEASAPTFAPEPEPAPIATGFPSVAPVRQSAWNASEGSHTRADEQEHAQAAAGDRTQVMPAPAAPVGSDVPPAAPEVPTPWQSTPAPSAEAPAWSPQPAWEPPPLADVPVPESTGQWAPTPAWGAEQPAAPAAPQQGAPEARPADVPRPAVPAHASFSPQTTFTPEPPGYSFDDQGTNALAHNADIAQQALAELSQLSSYRPKTVSGTSPSTLQRRTPGTIPAAPEIERPRSGQRVDRDANQVRSLLSSFQSGTTRGREASDGAAQNGHNSSGEVPHPAGHEDGPTGHGEPVTTPDTDLNPRSTSW